MKKMGEKEEKKQKNLVKTLRNFCLVGAVFITLFIVVSVYLLPLLRG